MSDYRFGFNGKENDNEVKGTGNQQDYGMRIYDPRLGKFLSADPLIVQEQQYPWYSPYQFAGNKPINSIDLDGLEECEVSVLQTSLGADAAIELQNQQSEIFMDGVSYAGRNFFANPGLFALSVFQVIGGNIASGGDMCEWPSWAVPRQVDENWNLVKKRGYLSENPTTQETSEMLGNTFSVVTFFAPLSNATNAVTRNAINFVVTNTAGTILTESLPSGDNTDNTNSQNNGNSTPQLNPVTTMANYLLSKGTSAVKPSQNTSNPTSQPPTLGQQLVKKARSAMFSAGN